ncbi:two-component regulator propeller domain-containing protein [Algoriphagus sp. NG3]|uniref:two-component regulator propeller domain-containing protein n=1 Tax=Algoriphagus sp. NG3 TaxID=3097546 RepID=UPI002A7F800C|nr:two-component regulator propeller domain-containing protein [Algoriphagus sp. NG3]WPR75941.1 two-component regulator propeller domain-containing protein [Algoriphagus sp. NG3]
MRIILTLVLLVLLVHSGLSGNIGLPFFKYYSSQEYQGGIQNYAISQHGTGLIYVANNHGLMEYDGTTWRRHALPNGAKVRHVQIDASGVIYVSGQGDLGTFTPGVDGQLTFESLKTSLPEELQNLEEVWKVYFNGENVFFCTSERILVFDKSRRFQNSIVSDTSFESFHFSHNMLMVNEVGVGIKKLQDGVLVPLNDMGFFGDYRVTGILQLNQNKHLVFTRDHGVFSMNGKLVESWKGPKDLTINTALLLRNGTIALGSQLDGLRIIDGSGNELMKLDKDNGLNNNSIVSLFEDLNGNLWVGHNNGITMVQLSLPFTKINQFSGLTGTGYHATYDQGKIYYGTNNGVFAQKTSDLGGPEVSLIRNSTGQVYQIKSIQNQLLVAHNDGAFVIKGEEAHRIAGPGGVWNFQHLHGRQDLILVGSYNGLHLYEIHEGTIQYLRQIEGFSESSRIIEQDDRGNIWVAHGYKGLYRLQLDELLETATVAYYGADAGLPTAMLNNVWRINNRLVFTTQAGIFKFDEQNNRFERDDFFKPYFEEGFLAHFLSEDQMGNIYYIGETEIGVLEKKVDGSYTKNFQVFNKLLPLLNDDLQNISILQGNEVLFAAKEGFVRFSLNDSKYQSAIFSTLIRRVYLTGASDSLVYGGNAPLVDMRHQNQNQSNRLKIPFKLANIRFESSNPTPNNEMELRFQYWLEGLEPKFGDWIDKPEKAFTNLREGNYTFHVKSKNLFGEVSPTASYSFEVLPPWYRSRVAYAVYLLVISLLTFLIYRIIESRYQKKELLIKTASKRVIQEKESELKHTQAEIEKLKTEKLKQEIHLKDKELATATMHLITKNGFIDQLRNNLNGITKKSKNQEIKNEIQKVIKNIENNFAGDRDWEQFEIHFDQVHGDFMSRFKKEYGSLSPQEIKLSAYLRMNLSTKEIAYLMNITVRGVEIARYRLRKKLGLVRTDNLQEYILKF